MPLASKVRSLATGSLAIIATRLIGAGVGFATQFLLVRAMGAHELGLFYAASSLAAVAGVFVCQGYPQLAARFIGRYRNKKDERLTGYFTGHALRDALTAACAAAALIALWAALWPDLPFEDRVAYGLAGVLLLPTAILNVMTNIAGGIRAFNLCYMPEGLVKPIIFFAVIAPVCVFAMPLDGMWAMVIFTIITIAIAAVVMRMVAGLLPPMRFAARARPLLARRWRREAWQLVLMAVFLNFFADVCILVSAPFLSNAETAVFGLCLKLALLVGYFVQIGQQMAVPDMADARHAGDTGRLRHAAWRSIMLPSLLTLLSLAGVSLFGDTMLALFGPEFPAGRAALVVLVLAQVVRALGGPGAHMLTLHGNQAINMALAVSSLIVLYLASAVLSPAYGYLGAALAVLVTQAYWTAVTVIVLRLLREPSMDVAWAVTGR